MNWFPAVLVVHLLGVILWVGGVFAAGRVLLLRVQEGDAEGKLASAEVRLFKSLGGHGMMQAVLAGIVLTALRGGYYLHQGWFHAKLALVVALIGFHMALRVKGKKLGAGPSPESRGAVVALNAGVAASAILIIALVFTQPF